MPRSQKNDNFIDKTFSIIADLIVKILPTNKESKEAFYYYKDGMAAQSEGEYAEALACYYQALKIEKDPMDKSFILYNIGLIQASNGQHARALEYYHESLKFNPNLVQALNNIAVIYHYYGNKLFEQSKLQEAKLMFDKASNYWRKAIKLAPYNYIEAQNWLKITGRITEDIML
uniref:Photosystem I assembly protein Ycf3 n=1 Tax=Cyanidium caldarium TaxID=2771 RepID=YCF3_CYACA|nr:photosystem I assembly protein Ycf3 [Cyanidium caldarium]Q9TM42.1 RecName: Full=Photosystem I assembly protein Ycf3 [Cyanidium caldarium]AAF13021.1 unknown [Cyanidium caldarium]WDB00151.1 photosystem I assembly protein Ycf3 [Cyanidium caldarium]